MLPNHNFLYDCLGQDEVHIIGEVRNDTRFTVASVNITVVLRNASGKIVGSGQTVLGSIPYLGPGQIAPFDARVFNPGGWVTYTILPPRWTYIGYNVTPPRLVDEPTSSWMTWGGLKVFRVVGEVINEDTRPHRALVFVVMYDNSPERKVIGLDWQALESIDPGQQWPFDVIVSCWKNNPDTSNYGGYEVLVYDDSPYPP